MKRSTPTPIVALGLIGLVLGFLIEVGAAASGRPIFVPPATMPFTLVVVGVIVVALAWPIRQATRGKTKRRVDPFRATRVAVLAKASSLSGALLLGGGLGMVLYILSRPVLPSVESLWLAIGTALGAGILLAGGLLAEHFCTLPPGSTEEDEPEGAAHA